MGGKLVYKIFNLNVISMHLSGTWQFWPFEGWWIGLYWGAYGLSNSEGRECAQVGDKAHRRGGVFKNVRHNDVYIYINEASVKKAKDFYSINVFKTFFI